MLVQNGYFWPIFLVKKTKNSSSVYCVKFFHHHISCNNINVVIREGGQCTSVVARGVGGRWCWTNNITITLTTTTTTSITLGGQFFFLWNSIVMLNNIIYSSFASDFLLLLLMLLHFSFFLLFYYCLCWHLLFIFVVTLLFIFLLGFLLF